jgi:hypothetical protein
MVATAHSNRETPAQQARASHFLHTSPHDVVEEVLMEWTRLCSTASMGQKHCGAGSTHVLQQKVRPTTQQPSIPGMDLAKRFRS